MHKISTCSEMVRYVDEVGFLPLLPIGITGWSADDVVDSDCRYVALPEGGWEWALWRWKGEIIRESGCAYGKFFDKKAAFVSKEWWPDFCNYRRSVFPRPDENTIEDAILQTLRQHDDARPPPCLRVQRSEDAREVRLLYHEVADGLPYCYKGLRLPP